MVAWLCIAGAGLRMALFSTPWIVTAGIFVLPGLTDALLPVSAAWVVALALFVSRHQLASVYRSRDPSAMWFLALLALFLVVTWFSPHPGQGARMVVQGGIAFLLIPVVRAAAAPAERELFIRSAALSGLLLTATLVSFRLIPDLEIVFLESSIGGVLVEPASLRELLRGYWFQANNVLDPAKAGAVFINTNVASVFLSLHLAAAIGALLAYPHATWPRIAVPLLFVGMLATGSRVGAIIGILMLLVGLIAGRRAVGRAFYVLLALIGLVAVPLAFPTLERLQLSSLLQDERLLVWPVAVARILDHPILGGGFGDWERWLAARVQIFGVSRVLPPHNLILHLALWGGVVTVGVFAGLLIQVGRGVRVQLGVPGSTRALAIGVTLLLGSVLAHAMFDNFFLFDWHVGPMAAMLVSLLWCGTENGVSVPVEATPLSPNASAPTVPGDPDTTE